MERVLLNVAIGPHIHDGTRASEIMNGYLIALAPAAIWGCFMYKMIGVQTLMLSIGSAIIFEWLTRLIMRRNITLADGSAVVGGLILGMMMPANTAWWIVILANLFMIVIAKQFFGGIGYYPFNPVLLGYLISAVSWPLHLNAHYTLTNFNIDAVHLEPLIALKSFGPQAAQAFSRTDLILGHQVGGVGTGAILLLIIGGVFLIVRGYISGLVSLSYLVGIIVFQGIFFAVDPSKYADPIFHLFSGMTIFGIFFLSSEFSTCPVNKVARIIYGAGAALLTILIRNFGIYPDGTVFALLIMNMFHPLIDRIKPPVLGLNAKELVLTE